MPYPSWVKDQGNLIFPPLWCYVSEHNLHKEMYFFMQLVGLYQDPKGDTVFGNHETGNQPSSTNVQLAPFESEKVKCLHQKIHDLEENLAQLSKGMIITMSSMHPCNQITCIS